MVYSVPRNQIYSALKKNQRSVLALLSSTLLNELFYQEMIYLKEFVLSVKEAFIYLFIYSEKQIHFP